MVISDYSPVIVFVYNRADKAKKTISSLENNDLSKNTDVYIFSDGPKNENSVDGVNKVRVYLDKLELDNCFHNLVVEKSPINKGLAKSIISGVTRIINEYGRAIIVEDDLILSKYFLNYMNECLDYYKYDDRIWSISGYSPRFNALNQYENNVYLDYRASSWGWATWKDRWDKVDWTVPDYGKYRFNPLFYIKFCRGGNDLPSMMKAQMRGKIDSWAVRWCYYQSRFDKLSVAPKASLVSNDGFDGSGTHTNYETAKKIGNGDLSDASMRLSYCDKELFIDRRIVRGLKKIHDISVFIRFRDKVYELLRR